MGHVLSGPPPGPEVFRPAVGSPFSRILQLNRIPQRAGTFPSPGPTAPIHSNEFEQ
ncbi:hypothetical protein KPATCC21470_6361 [Kitasatospora purpeofusca]